LHVDVVAVELFEVLSLLWFANTNLNGINPSHGLLMSADHFLPHQDSALTMGCVPYCAVVCLVVQWRLGVVEADMVSVLKEGVLPHLNPEGMSRGGGISFVDTIFCILG